MIFDRILLNMIMWLNMEEIQEKTKKEYTLNFILNPSIAQEGVSAYKENINEAIQNAGGNIQSSVCQMTPQKLAYPIKKGGSGYLCESTFVIDSDAVPQINEGLSRDKNLMRFIIQSKERNRVITRERRVRKKPLTKTFSPESADTASLRHENEDAKEKREKVSIEEIDKKLDEIIKNI